MKTEQKNMLELNNTINQMNLADIYRTFQLNTKEYAFFSVTHTTFSKINHILGNKASINKYNKI